MEHDEATLRQMLEYIYTNRVKDMPGLSADEVIKLLALANGEPSNPPSPPATGADPCLPSPPPAIPLASARPRARRVAECRRRERKCVSAF